MILTNFQGHNDVKIVKINCEFFTKICLDGVQALYGCDGLCDFQCLHVLGQMLVFSGMLLK